MRIRSLFVFLALAASLAMPIHAQPMPGAVFTTNSACGGVDLNLFDLRQDVYLNGGPHHPGSAGLPDGYYYVQVTAPDGTPLGSSLTTAPAQVSGGSFVQCYRLWDILWKYSDPTQRGYDLTPNNGGEYKVWVSSSSEFGASVSKTDNFKVREVAPPPPPEPPRLFIHKFYDANANGVFDPGEIELSGWKVSYTADQLTWVVRFTLVDEAVTPGTYTVSEFMPIQPGWVPTTGLEQTATLVYGDTVHVRFGNLLLGPGGGLTLGFWSNKNGQSLVGADDLALLRSLNLKTASGGDFDPTAYNALRTWLLNGTATNMSYMLSVQLTAMELNVFNGKVGAGALIYAPGAASANPLGFATVGAVMAEANAQLALYPVALSDSPVRGYLEALKNALDNANNNKNFVQPGPGPFSF
jgi:hypothetical protein